MSHFRLNIIIVYSSLIFLVQLYLVHSDTLELVQILHRHGAKNPEYLTPKDPYNNEDFWPGGWGQLTDIGVEQTYELGQFFRKRYGDFISEKYDQYETYVVSTDTERTIRSALAALAGLYGQPAFNAATNQTSERNWPPVPIRTINPPADNIIGNKRACPTFSNMMTDFLHNSDFMVPINEEHRALFDYINEHTGLNMTVLDKELGYFYDGLVFEVAAGYTLANWTEPIMNNKTLMNNLIALSLSLKSHTQEFQRFSIGPFLELIRENMYAKTETIKTNKVSLNPGEQPLLPRLRDVRRKLVIFSGHDTTMVRLMNSLGVYEHIRPPFASALMLELYKNSTGGNYYVELWYRNETEREPYFLSLQPERTSKRNKRNPISLEAFFRKIEPLIPEDWGTDCCSEIPVGENSVQLQREARINSEVNLISGFFIGSVFGVCLAGLISMMLVKFGLRKREQLRAHGIKSEYIWFD